MHVKSLTLVRPHPLARSLALHIFLSCLPAGATCSSCLRTSRSCGPPSSPACPASGTAFTTRSWRRWVAFLGIVVAGGGCIGEWELAGARCQGRELGGFVLLAPIALLLHPALHLPLPLPLPLPSSFSPSCPSPADPGSQPCGPRPLQHRLPLQAGGHAARGPERGAAGAPVGPPRLLKSQGPRGRWVPATACRVLAGCLPGRWRRPILLDPCLPSQLPHPHAWLQARCGC